MAHMKPGKLEPFAVLTLIQSILAGLILINELRAMSEHFPGGVYPFEHQSSWARVLIFCTGAALCVLVAWVLNTRKQWIPLLPPLKLVLPLAVLPILAGAVQSHYLTRMGWCCENPIASFFGFPFTFLYGIWGYDPSIIQYADDGLIEILGQSAFRLNWQVDFYRLGLNIMFWSGLIFTLLAVISVAFRRGRIRRPPEEYPEVETR